MLGESMSLPITCSYLKPEKSLQISGYNKINYKLQENRKGTTNTYDKCDRLEETVFCGVTS